MVDNQLRHSKTVKRFAQKYQLNNNFCSSRAHGRRLNVMFWKLICICFLSMRKNQQRKFVISAKLLDRLIKIIIIFRDPKIQFSSLICFATRQKLKIKPIIIKKMACVCLRMAAWLKWDSPNRFVAFCCWLIAIMVGFCFIVGNYYNFMRDSIAIRV